MSEVHGIVPPMVTPFDKDGELMEDAHRAEVRFLVEKVGVPGVAVCGSTGEGQTITTDETRRITAATVEEAAGRLGHVSDLDRGGQPAVLAGINAEQVDRAAGEGAADDRPLPRLDVR